MKLFPRQPPTQVLNLIILSQSRQQLIFYLSSFQLPSQLRSLLHNGLPGYRVSWGLEPQQLTPATGWLRAAEC